MIFHDLSMANDWFMRPWDSILGESCRSSLPVIVTVFLLCHWYKRTHHEMGTCYPVIRRELRSELGVFPIHIHIYIYIPYSVGIRSELLRVSQKYDSLCLFDLFRTISHLPESKKNLKKRGQSVTNGDLTKFLIITS